MTAEKLKSVSDVVKFVRTSLKKLGDPEKATKMAAYMKTEMPFYGVQSPDRKTVFRGVKNRFTIDDNDTYRELVESLWAEPKRESKYIALNIASETRKFITWENIDLYESLIREGAWWDFVDEVAPRCVGRLLSSDSEKATALVRKWNSDEDMWIRRASVISQLKQKKNTDADLLFELCEARLHEKEFFIRKGIGWALREYAKTDPDAVLEFLETHRDDMSGLTFREGAKHLIVKGLIEK